MHLRAQRGTHVGAGPMDARRSATSRRHPAAAGRRANAAPGSTSATAHRCKLCGEAIQPAEAAVRFSLSTSGARPNQHRQRHPQNATCHARCMQCFETGCNAVENLQLGKDGRVYCQKHHDLRCAPRCAQCEEPIRGGESFVTAMKGSKFHPRCFVCASCQQPLAEGGRKRGGTYAIGDDGLAYCRRDFKRLFAPRCAACAVSMTTWVEADLSPNVEGGKPTKLCRRCATEGPFCFSCHAVQTSQSQPQTGSGDGRPFSDLPDGRVVCPTCTSTYVRELSLVARHMAVLYLPLQF